MSQRTNIRNAIGSAITGAAVVPTANLLRGRDRTITSVSFPACAVYAVTEAVEVQSLAPNNRVQYRTLDVNVDYFIKQSGSTILDDLLDTGSAAVEAAVLADVTLGGNCRDLHLTSVNYVIEPDEDFQWGVARHQFRAIYLTTD